MRVIPDKEPASTITVDQIRKEHHIAVIVNDLPYLITNRQDKWCLVR